jgi:hypothetical protein
VAKAEYVVRNFDVVAAFARPCILESMRVMPNRAVKRIDDKAAGHSAGRIAAFGG